MTGSKSPGRVRRLLLAALVVALPMVEGAIGAPAPGTRNPYQKHLNSTDCKANTGVDTFVCRVDFPPVPQNRRREITYVSCFIQTDSTAELNFLNVNVDPVSNVFVNLIPVHIGSGGTKQFQSSDQILLYLKEGDQIEIAAGLQAGVTIFSLSCMVSGETIVTN
ncbi:MAG TPA: hypothetical protein VGA77_00445 [Propylenella sp.]